MESPRHSNEGPPQQVARPPPCGPGRAEHWEGTPAPHERTPAAGGLVHVQIRAEHLRRLLGVVVESRAAKLAPEALGVVDQGEFGGGRDHHRAIVCQSYPRPGDIPAVVGQEDCLDIAQRTLRITVECDP